MHEREAYAKIFATAIQSGQSDLADVALRHLRDSSDRALDLSGINDAIAIEFTAQVQALTGPAASNRAASSPSPSASIRSNRSKASQESFDPRDEFDQIIQSMIDRICLYAGLHERSWISRTILKRRGQKTLKQGLKEFCGHRMVLNFGMSDHTRRFHMKSHSSEYRRRLDLNYQQLLALQESLFEYLESIREIKKPNENEVDGIFAKLEDYQSKIDGMKEDIRAAPFFDSSPEGQQLEAS